MSLLILAPADAAPAYTLAAEAFQSTYEKVTGKTIPIATEDDGTSDLVVIGSDSVNDYLMHQMLELNFDALSIRYGTDDYCIQSQREKGRNVLILAGGRGRSTIYAVYDYFERFADCHYFWDGDVIPHRDSLPMENISIVESPRFEYRGIRYFAHRGLKRFQAEHWNWEDWKKELNWMLKKRMNFFMLRIGMDDIWQKAFPEDVPYPESYQTLQEAGFQDRTDFWTLKYRGELREKIMQYARDLDLTSPVDCGTMTHWYSRTPQSFLDSKKPSFLTQEVSYYASGAPGNVFDITNKKMLSHYTKLTETMVNEYDHSSSLFHTIGLGERSMYEDPKKNFALKKLAYRRVFEEIRTKYPHSKIMLATWDFAGWWHASEVEKFTKELDPNRTIFLDYTCEVVDPKSCFLNWGLVGKFPWTFGIFHAFASESEIRGPYDRIEERFQVAANDPYCQGMIYWPELSHSDPLILEYLSQNCWKPNSIQVNSVIERMCQTRYGDHASAMEDLWLGLLPVIKLGDWGSRTQRDPNEENYEDYARRAYTHSDLWTRLTLFLSQKDSDDPVLRKFFIKRVKKYAAVKGLAEKALSDIPTDVRLSDNAFIRRDVIDLVRTMLGRYLNLIIMVALENSNTEEIKKLKSQYQKLMNVMVRLLGTSPEFSMWETLKDLRKTAPVNPNFEITLKRNLCNFYCLQPAYEVASVIFSHEIDAGFDFLLSENKDKVKLNEEREKILSVFWETPLSEMQPDQECDLNELISSAAKLIKETESVVFS